MNSKSSQCCHLLLAVAGILALTAWFDTVRAEETKQFQIDSIAQVQSDSVAVAGTTISTPNTRSLAERTGAKSASPMSELPTSGNSITAIMRMIGALCAVLALMWVVVLIAKRYFKGRSPGSNGIKQMLVVETLWLGPKKQIVLLSVGSRHVVVGVTDETMSTLSELTSEEMTSVAHANKKTTRTIETEQIDQKRSFEGLLAQAGGRLQHLLKRTNPVT